jgi:cation transport regulator
VREHLPAQAQVIFLTALNNAWDTYADPAKRRGAESQEEAAFRVAWAAVKHEYAKNTQTGQWEPKRTHAHLGEATYDQRWARRKDSTMTPDTRAPQQDQDDGGGIDEGIARYLNPPLDAMSVGGYGATEEEVSRDDTIIARTFSDTEPGAGPNYGAAGDPATPNWGGVEDQTTLGPQQVRPPELRLVWEGEFEAG